jgi:hypothetical protein
MNHYYYLHTNGDLIHKPKIVVDADPDYFDSPFVRKYWQIDTEDRTTAYIFLIDAAAMGARKQRVDELKEKWRITDEDCQVFAEKTGFKLFQDGDQWCAAKGDFENLQKDPVGFGDTPFDAFVELARELKGGNKC